MTSEDDLKSKKKARKEELKAKADEMGISYEELKNQKKEAKSMKKRTRESDSLDDSEHKLETKRLRSWSHDEGKTAETKRRTRSMDAAEEKAVKSNLDSSLSPEEWRKANNITIKGHGKNSGDRSNDFPSPFLKFSDAPFVDAVQRTFQQLGFTSPTAIQAQVSNLIVLFNFF